MPRNDKPFSPIDIQTKLMCSCVDKSILPVYDIHTNMSSRFAKLYHSPGNLSQSYVISVINYQGRCNDKIYRNSGRFEKISEYSNSVHVKPRIYIDSLLMTG